ncbi:putrescine hydroxycinnamoyltransferase 1-like [Iris pallida]|uniref:Putrescine hydroxycinnamoyltransferase 1-like n=1 Tax=Iris pallida TaxID=29817 RepID=A0AAX6EHA3_IRIPA|nr:putrescine hydroxycinnamoyltransferase 1-like [Iris pallida]
MVEVAEWSLVAPNGEAPKNTTIWLSNLDFNVTDYHIPVVYIYRNCNGNRSAVAGALRAALAEALVPFYPLAGRLGVDADGRKEIHCTGEGAVFVVAHSDRSIDEELGDFVPSPEMMQLVPLSGLSYSPSILLLVQVTFFKCNGMTLGVASQHLAMDGYSALHFTNHWCKVARGRITELDVPPFLDRTVLRARSPPNPDLFYAIGYNPNSASGTAAGAPFTTAILKLSRKQVALLKSRSEQQSTFQAITAHAWRCACLARELAPNRTTRVYLFADVRTRMKPALPRGYFGNAVCRIAAAATSEEVVSSPISFGARKIRDATELVTDGYARSVIDYIELAGKDERRTDWLGFSEADDLIANSWLGLPFQHADFGWGRPEFMGKATTLGAGQVYVVSDTDGGVYVTVSLETQNMERFKKVFYEDIRECVPLLAITRIKLVLYANFSVSFINV